MKSIINKLIKFAKEKKKDKKKKKKEEEAQNPSPIAPEAPQPPVHPEAPQENPQQAEEALKALLGGVAEESESRTMLLTGELDEEKAAEILSGFIALSQLKPPKKNVKEGELPYDPITLYISTYGGSADEMFALFDMMDIAKAKCHIETIGMGKVMSAGTLLLAAGTKGHRKIGKNCRVMLHQVSAGTFGPLSNMHTEIEAIQTLQDSYIKAMVSCTNLSKRKLKSLLNERVNVYLTAQEAVEYGIADIII